MRTRSRSSRDTTKSTRDRLERPISTKRSGCSLSGAVIAFSSRKHSIASSNVTPCLLRLRAAFVRSHSKSPRTKVGTATYRHTKLPRLASGSSPPPPLVVAGSRGARCELLSAHEREHQADEVARHAARSSRRRRRLLRAAPRRGARGMERRRSRRFRTSAHTASPLTSMFPDVSPPTWAPPSHVNRRRLVIRFAR